MCTVTWLEDEFGYQLFCNRDEKLVRSSAEPPRISKPTAYVISRLAIGTSAEHGWR